MNEVSAPEPSSTLKLQESLDLLLDTYAGCVEVYLIFLGSEPELDARDTVCSILHAKIVDAINRNTHGDGRYLKILVSGLIRVATNDCRLARTVAQVYRLTSSVVDSSISDGVIKRTLFMFKELQTKFEASPTDPNVLAVISEIFLVSDDISLRNLHVVMLTILVLSAFCACPC